jgi:hypothetical protein
VVVEKRTPDIPEGIPHRLAALLGRCFSYEPADRPSPREVLEVGLGFMMTPRSALEVRVCEGEEWGGRNEE